MSAIGMIGAGMIGLANNAVSQGMSSRAREENYLYNEKAAENALQRQKNLYEMYSSPRALREQYLAAGLSPGLMFSGNGAGGGTLPNAPEGAGVAGMQAQTFGVSAQDAASIELMNAQKENIQADTELKKQGSEKTKSEIQEIIENTNNLRLKNTNLDIENKLADIKLKIASATEQDVIQTTHKQLEEITKGVEKLDAELRSSLAHAEIDEQTVQTIVEYRKKELEQIGADIFLKHSQSKLAKSGVELNKAQAESLYNSISLNWAELEQRGKEYTLDKDKLEKQVEQWGLENGLTEREQNIKIAAIVAEFINENMGRFLETLTSLLKLVK